MGLREELIRRHNINVGKGKFFVRTPKFRLKAGQAAEHPLRGTGYDMNARGVIATLHKVKERVRKTKHQRWRRRYVK